MQPVEVETMANVASRRSTGRVIGGIALVIFGIAGGLGRLLSEPQTVLSQASKPLDNAVAIMVMLAFVAIGLGLMGALDGLRQRKDR
jgi:hypothetical protein